MGELNNHTVPYTAAMCVIKGLLAYQQALNSTDYISAPSC